MNASAALLVTGCRVRRELLVARAMTFDDLPGGVVLGLMAAFVVMFGAGVWLTLFALVASSGTMAGSDRLGIALMGVGPSIPAVLLWHHAWAWARSAEPVTFNMVGYPLYVRELS